MKAWRLEVKLGLATAAFFALVWWAALFMTKAVPDGADLGAWVVRGACVWGAWMTYRFFWARSRALGSRDSGARSTGLTSLLYFCLPGLAFFLADGVSWFITSGQDLRPPVWGSTAYGIPVGVLLPALAGLLWAAGKVSLVSDRERLRERPGLPRAVLSLLGLLVLGAGLAVKIVVAAPQAVGAGRTLISLCVLATSLITGLLAHRLAASAQESRPREEAPPLSVSDLCPGCLAGCCMTRRPVPPPPVGGRSSPRRCPAPPPHRTLVLLEFHQHQRGGHDTECHLQGTVSGATQARLLSVQVRTRIP